jgi:ribokinase
MKPSIVVVGSSNTDMVIKTAHLPAPGETILGGTFFMNAGGKGANQAVAAARLNGQVTFITKIGDDVFGKKSIQLYKDEGIDTSNISVDENLPSGVALITVDDNGENCIVVASGANAALNPADIRQAEMALGKASIILVQLEIPLETVKYIAEFAVINSIRFLLNPAPACPLTDDLISAVSIITPNKKEAEMLTGCNITDINTAKQAAKILADKGIKTVVITLGTDGALILMNDNFIEVPALSVSAVDTTAAGDIFNGALAVAISEQQDTEQAVQFANHAAAISVTRLGAQASAPHRNEVEALMNRIR